MSRALGIALYTRYSDMPLLAPKAPRTRSSKPVRPAAPVRWTIKLRKAVPASIRVFRRQVGEPLHQASIDVGTRIVSETGSHVGRVEEILVGVRNGHETVAVDATNLPKEWLLLVPSASLRAGTDDTMILRDPDGSVAVPRELTRVA